MAIPAQNIGYLQQGPVASGQQLATSGLEQLELAFLGTATFVLDGTLTTATLNYIDGINALNFTPRALMVVRIGGNAASSILAYGVDNANGGVSGSINFTAAGSSTNTVIVVVAAMK
jgi:hypothetical protein